MTFFSDIFALACDTKPTVISAPHPSSAKCWSLFLEYSILGQAYRITPLTAEEWEATKTQFDEKTWRTWPNPEQSETARFTREYVLRQFWQTFLDDRFDLKNATQPNAVFFVRHGSDGQNLEVGKDEEDWLGSRFAACMWIYTQAVSSNGQEKHARMQAPQVQIHHGGRALGVR